MRRAVVDIGSTACRLVVAEATGDGWFRRVVDRRVVLGLGRTVRRDGALGAGPTQLLDETARRLVDAAFRGGAEGLRVTVDQEVIAGTDGSDVRRGLAATVGGPVEVASAVEDMAATEVAVARRLGSLATPVTVELTADRLRVADGAAVHELPTGIRDLLPPRAVDPLHPAALHTLRAHLDAVLADLPAVPAADPAVLVGPLAVALGRAAVGRRWGRDGPAVDGVRLSAPVLADLERELLETSGARRLLLPGLDPAEVDEVTLTAIIVRSVVAHLAIPGVRVCTVGALEGRLLHDLEIVSADDDPSAAAVAASATPHGEHVATLVEQLACQLAEPLGLTAEDRRRVRVAARLHELGRLEGPSGPLPVAGSAAHRRGADLLLATGLPGVAPDELVELACLVRFQRGRPPGSHFAPYGRLPARRRGVVDRLTGLLRLACGLDAGEDGVVVAVHVDLDPDLLCVHAVGRAELDLALHAAGRHIPVVSALLGRRVVLRAAGTPARPRTARHTHGSTRPDLVG